MFGAFCVDLSVDLLFPGSPPVMRAPPYKYWIHLAVVSPPLPSGAVSADDSLAVFTGGFSFVFWLAPRPVLHPYLLLLFPFNAGRNNFRPFPHPLSFRVGP